MKYEDMSDYQLSAEVLKIENSRVGSYIHKHCRDLDVVTPTKCGSAQWGNGARWHMFNINNPSDIMPIAIEYKLSLEPHATKDTYFSATRHCDFNHQDKNPYRAIAICFLKMKESHNEQK